MSILAAALGLALASLAAGQAAPTTNRLAGAAGDTDAPVDPPTEAAAAGQLLPHGNLFDPLLADPRWPHMGASYQYYDNHDVGQQTAVVSLGGSITFYRAGTAPDSQWELGVQGGVFAIFDLGRPSEDLVNADYLVGPTWSWRHDDVAIITRLFHQSSHVGDEFLLANPGFDRQNYSFEAVDAILSRHLCDRAVRLYGGGRYRFDRDPSDLEHWSAQYGVEWQSRRTYANGLLRPIAAVDVQHHQQNDWEADVSVRAGVQIEGADLRGHPLQIVGEYYNGHSPHGQFYADRVQFTGVGVHLYY